MAKEMELISGTPAPFTTGTLRYERRVKREAGRTYALQVNYDAASTFTPTVYVSNDGTNWIPLPSANVTVVQPAASGAERTTGLNLSFAGWEHLRIDLAWGAGSANISPPLISAQA